MKNMNTSTVAALMAGVLALAVPTQWAFATTPKKTKKPKAARQVAELSDKEKELVKQANDIFAKEKNSPAPSQHMQDKMQSANSEPTQRHSEPKGASGSAGSGADSKSGAESKKGENKP